MIRPRSALLIALATCIFAPRAAMAGEVEKAEHRRLSEDMEKKAQRNVWAGVERDFQLLLELQKKGEVLSYDDWYLGAQAARGLGDMTACRERLVKAAEVQATDEVKTWISEIDATYAPVSIRSGDKDNVPTLTFEGALFATDQRMAVEAAQTAVSTSRSFQGLLPQGNYVLTSGTLTQNFTVTAGQALVEVKLGPAAAQREGGGGLAYVGPRIDLGPSFTANAGLDEALVGSVPTKVQGAGARAAVGLELGLTGSLGVGVGVGYHNLISPGGEGAATPTSLHLGFGQLGVSYRMKDLRISANGQWGAGVGQAPGTTLDELCSAGNAPEELGVYCGNTGDWSSYSAPLTGKVMMGGGNASVSYALFSIGKSLTGGVSLAGGAMSDSQRMYPWGQVAFTIAPVPSQE